jgi:hypothetical protein
MTIICVPNMTTFGKAGRRNFVAKLFGAKLPSLRHPTGMSSFVEKRQVIG